MTKKIKPSKAKLFLLTISFLLVAGFLYFKLPIILLGQKFPELKDFMNPNEFVSNDRLIKRGIFDTYVVYSQDPCSGLYCPRISCYKVRLGSVSKIGEAESKSVGEKPDIDYKNCSFQYK